MKSQSGETVDEGWWLVTQRKLFCVVRICHVGNYLMVAVPGLPGHCTTKDILSFKFEFIRKLDLEKLANDK